MQNLLIHSLVWKFIHFIEKSVWESGSSNLIVDNTYLIVALRTFVLPFVLNELLPKRRVFIAQRDLGDSYPYFLWCSGEYVFQ